jgi:hypothetical protein
MGLDMSLRENIKLRGEVYFWGSTVEDAKAKYKWEYRANRGMDFPFTTGW